MFCCTFLWTKGLNAKVIHKEIFPVYSGKCLLRKDLHNWIEKVYQGRLIFADDARPGRPFKIATEATVQRLEELIGADRWITTGSVANALGSSRGFADSITHDRLKLRKVCARWVPRELKN
jgi:hypothetical protein